MLKIDKLVDSVDSDSDESLIESTTRKIREVPSNFRASSTAIEMDADDFLVLDVAGDMNNCDTISSDSEQEKEVEEEAKEEKGANTEVTESVAPVDKKLQKLLSKAVCRPDIEIGSCRSQTVLGQRALKKLRKMELEKTAGKKWFDMPATELTDEARMDLELLQMRKAIDPLAFYRGNDTDKLPKYFQIGRIVDAPEDYYSGRLTKAERKRNMLDELLVNEDFVESKTEVYKKLKVQESKKVRGTSMAKRANKKKGDKGMEKK